MVKQEWWLLELEEVPAGMLLGWNGHGGTTISLLSTEFNRPAGSGMNIILLFRSLVPHDSLTYSPTYQPSVTAQGTPKIVSPYVICSRPEVC